MTKFNLSEMKRLAQQGAYSLEMLEWFGKSGDDIRENLRGIRKAIGSNSVAIILENADGNPSELRICSAKLFECDGEHLTIYGIGERLPTEEEQAVLDQWKAIEEDYYEKSPHGNAFWKKKKFFEESACPWMYPYLDRMIRGMKYDQGKSLVRDNKVRGTVLIRYRIHWKNGIPE